jgi:hypothetical protein
MTHTQLLELLVKYTALISLGGAGIGFVFATWKYIDQRNREERTRRFQIYHDLMRTISAFDKDGSACPLTQQLAAIYELRHFKDYAFSSIPVLEHLKVDYTNRTAPAVLVKALEDTIISLR